MDYCFLRRAENHDKITILLIKDRDSRAIRAQIVESKGVACEEAVEAALRGIHEFGHRDKVILKADGEPAAKALKEEVLKRMPGGGFASQPVAHEHESNGTIENGVKLFKGLFRVHLIALEKKIDGHIPIDHPIISWLAEFIGDVVSKYLVGMDGKTAFERLFGKACREEHLEFGEAVLWRRPRGQDSNVVAEARWEFGVWVGRRWGTPHHLVSHGNRVIECRAIQRVPKIDRWKRELVDAVRATRWANPAPAGDAVAPAVLPGPAEPPPAPPGREYAPRNVYIRPEDIRRFGRTAGCRRCTLMTNGEPARGINHTKECRARLEQAMADAGDVRVRAAAERRERHREGRAEPLAEQPVHVPAERPAEEEAAEGGVEAGAARRVEIRGHRDGGAGSAPGAPGRGFSEPVAPAPLAPAASSSSSGGAAAGPPMAVYLAKWKISMTPSSGRSPLAPTCPGRTRCKWRSTRP